MKKPHKLQPKRLALTAEKIRSLSESALEGVGGGDAYTKRQEQCLCAPTYDVTCGKK